VAHAPLASCYRRALEAKKAPVAIDSSIALTIDMTGRVTEAVLARDGDLPGLRSCVEGALRHVLVRDVDTGDGSASVQLVFRP
jgi:hypothetical protein